MKRISNIYVQRNVYYKNNKLILDITGSGRCAFNFENVFFKLSRKQK